MGAAVTNEQIYAGVRELRNSGLLRPDITLDSHAAALMVCVSRIHMAMDKARPLGMTREGEIFDPRKM